MPTLRNIKHVQKTVLRLSASKRLHKTSQQRHLQNNSKRRKTLRNPDLADYKILQQAFGENFLNSLFCFHKAFLHYEDLVETMFESIIVDLLVLISVTLLLIVVAALFRLVWLKSAEVNRLRQVLHGTIKKVVSADHVCQHHFGCLKSLSKGKPIPSECMGCSDVFECLTHKE